MPFVVVRLFPFSQITAPYSVGKWLALGSLSTWVFETWTATGSELFSLLTCFHATTFTLPSIFSPLEMITIKIWETPLSWHMKYSLPVAVSDSKTRVLKLPIIPVFPGENPLIKEPEDSVRS